ncbi:transcription factor TFIIIB component B'' homolog [Lacerta agilis]|uniref:transcription factor TFIIIB component B'' homolog n=1 Tax=Lacerta agilis TaxID=80427 RepID=UPI00141934EB|nr:transcription factor TFIIIB component B'' homolog [Lacerta agilis]
MFRRARFNVKPNVRPGAAAAAAAARGSNPRGSPSPSGGGAAAPDPGPQPGSASAPCSSEDAASSALPSGAAGNLQQDDGSSSSSPEGNEKTNASGDGDCSRHAETLLQRRKRISTMPNLAKPRVAPLSTRVATSASKCSQKQVPHSPVICNPPLQKDLPPSEKTNVENSPKSPILPEKKTPVPQVPQFSPFKKSVSKEPNACVTGQRSDEALQKNTSSPLKERPTQESLIQEEIPHSKCIPAKEKRTFSDREKIVKAQKLRKMLKEELKKEKQQQKYKYPVIEKSMPEDRSKMVMRDFIYYLPENNPMKSSLVEEKKSEKPSTVTQAKEPEIILESENEEDEDEEEGGDDDDGPLLVPRVKVAEDGSIILDEESLTVEVLRTKGQCVVEDNDPIFERGSTTTYSSFRRSYYTKPWSEKETDMFFLAISMVGTDFSMISQLFPHRARTEIKNKFKREEKANGWRIDKAFKEKTPFDFDFFTKLLEKVLENEKRKKDKDAKCQHQKEKNLNEKKTLKKKRKAKVVNGQANHGQDDPQNARISDAEMEVDAGTAEKENEESPSILEQADGQTLTESVMVKKKRKRKKKNSEQEAENLPDERTISAEVAEGDKTRKKRKNLSSNVEINGTEEIGEELEAPDEETPAKTLPSVEEDPQVDEETEGDLGSTLSGIQKGNEFLDIDSGEADDSDASSEHHVVQPSESQMSLKTNKEGFEENSAAKNEVADLDQPDENTAFPSCNDELMETDRAAIEKPTLKGQLQRLASELSEERELPVNDTSEGKISLSEILVAAEKSSVQDKTANITEPPTEQTDRASNVVANESQDTQKGPVVRGRRQKPKPNILKVSSRKEAPLRDKPEKPEAEETVGKNNDQHDALSIITEETAEKDCQVLDTESLASRKSTSQESSKQAVLKPAPLARGRIQRPKPNLGRVARKSEEPARNMEAEEGKATDAAIESSEKIQIQAEYNSHELLTVTTEAASYEADIPHCNVLEDKAVASAEKVLLAHTSQSPVKTLFECESHEFKNAFPSSNKVEDVQDLTTRDSSFVQEENENSAEVEPSLKSLKENTEKGAETEEFIQAEKEMLTNEHKTDSRENIMSEGSKSSHLDETIACVILPPSLLSEGNSADTQEAAATNETHLSPPSHSDFKSSDPNEILSSPDIQEKITVGKQSTVQPTPFLRGRFQRPKPNIGRAVGRKETPSLGNEATAAAGTEKSELQKHGASRILPAGPQLKSDRKKIPAESLENRLVDMEKIIQEDPQAPSTSQNISDQYPREKPTSQENKPCTIKPAQLVRSRFQRVRPNLGRMNDKKEDPVSESITAPVEGDIGKAEMTKESDLHPPSEDNVNVQASLGDLEKKEVSESSEAPSPKRYIDQQKVDCPEKPQGCELPKDQKEMFVSKDVEGKCLDPPERYDVSGAHEESLSKSIKSTLLLRGPLLKPKPNLAQAAKKKKASSKGEVSTKEKTGSDTQSNTTPSDSKSGKIPTLMHYSTSSSESRQRNHIDSIETMSPTGHRHSGKGSEESQQPPWSGSQIKKETSKAHSVQERASERIKGKQVGRTVKQRKNISGSITSFTSECENDLSEKGKHYQKGKPNVGRGRSSKPVLRKNAKKEYGNSKVNLVTLRASSQQEDDDDDDDGDDFEPDYEVECFSPEEVNKAPVFVPKGLRSPNPVPVQIEETMEELEIYENVADEPFLSHELNVDAQPVIQIEKRLYSSQNVSILISLFITPFQYGMITGKPVGMWSLVVCADAVAQGQEKKAGISDGSTEAAMTLLAMRDPAFQLNIGIQEQKIQEFPSKDEMNVTDSFPNECHEEQSIVHCHMQHPAPSENELLSSVNAQVTAAEDRIVEPSGLEVYLQEATNVSLSKTTNTAAAQHCSTSVLEACSEETTRISSDLLSSKGDKSSKQARCRFPKPKPNLNRSLRLSKNASQKYVDSCIEQSEEIQNEKKVSDNAVEEQKVELEKNHKLNELTKSSSAEKHNLQLPSSSPVMQKDNIERDNTARETWEVASLLTASEVSPEADPPEPPGGCSTNISAQVSAPAEHQLLAIKPAQTEAAKCSSISSTAEMTAVVSAGVEEYPKGEEPTFILTLVEISVGPENCSDGSGSLQQTSEQLLPAPVFFTPDNLNSTEVAREDNFGFVTAAVEENAVSLDNTAKAEGLLEASLEQLAGLGSTSWQNLKRHAEALEESGNAPEKKKRSSPIGGNLESTNKGASIKSSCIPRKAAGKKSGKLNISKKKTTSTSRSVPKTTELKVMEREHPQSSLNLGAVLLDEAATTGDQVSRTRHARKSETSEKQKNSVETCKSVQSEQAGGTAVIPKTQLSRSYKRSLGFLPLICKNNNNDDEVTSKGSKQPLQEPHILVAENTVEFPKLSSNNKEDTQENSLFPSTSNCENGSYSTVQILSELSENEGISKEQEKEEEPTRISEYFFSDIFMEVDDSE